MSWNPLKKRPVSRQPAISLVIHEQENDFERHLTNLQKLDDSSRKLHKEAKKCTESFAELARSEQKLTSNLSSSQLCHHDERLREVSEEYFSISKAMDQHTNELILITQKAVLEPVKKYNNIFTHMNTSLKKRDHLIAECQKLQAKLDKQKDKEKTGPNIVKTNQLQKQLAQIQDELFEHTSQLCKDMPQVYDTRILYFNPCFEAFVKGEIEYFGRTTQLFNELAVKTQQSMPTRDDSMIMKNLSEIKSLSIVAD